MPEHDETDAPELAEEDEFWAEVDELAAKRRKSKAERLGVEDKVVKPSDNK